MQQIDPMGRPAIRHPGEVIDVRLLLDRHGLPSQLPGEGAKGSPPAALARWLLVGAGSTDEALCLGGAGSDTVVALKHEAISLQDVLRLHLSPGAALGRWPDAAAGLVMVLSYDNLAAVACREHDEVIQQLASAGKEAEVMAGRFAPSYARKLLSAVRVDAQREIAMLVCDRGREREARLRLDALLESASRLARQPGFFSGVEASPRLVASVSDKAYLNAASEVIAQVREGRWYQLNLLRYFDLEFSGGRDDGDVPPGIMPPGWFPWRMDVAGGRWSVLLDGPAGRIMSLSPERFTAVRPDRDGAVLQTFPVKGTIPRDLDPAVDRQNAEALLRSRKDLAELHMIVDLMRNDFHRIATSGSVTVPVEQIIRSHANVHHLHAEVRARVGRGVSFASLVGAICPAGSITGTPKLEVVKGIRELEQRSRGYHMGNVFHWQPDGRLDSSVLIRTIFARHSGAYELAAGSGIVVHSNPESELAEVMAKARIATAPLSQFAGCT